MLPSKAFCAHSLITDSSMLTSSLSLEAEGL